MDYNYDLFTTTRETDDRTPYRYLLKGAFYDVYTDGHGDYHMAKECEASLRERFWFYENRIQKQPYPVIEKAKGIIFDNQLSMPTLLQVLGLPEEVFLAKDGCTHQTIHLTGLDAINRISFEDGLFFGYGKEPELDDSIVETSDYCVIGLINYWIENGFYFPNPERLFNNADVDFVYPVFVDEAKVPQFLRKRHETAERLFIDFVENPLGVSLKDYIDDFKPLTEMSMEEMASLAFNTPRKAFDERQHALQNYFTLMLAMLGNRFFRKEYQRNNIFPISVMEEDFGFGNVDFPLLAVGSRFVMPKTDYRHFEAMEHRVAETFTPGRYHLFKSDLKGLKTAFEAMKTFFGVHPDYRYMPQMAVKLIGLPYPAFEICRFFDFERGTFEQFIDLFDVVDSPSPAECGIHLLASEDGVVHLLDFSNKRTDDILYLNHALAKGLYVSSPAALFEDAHIPTLLCFDAPDKRLQRLFAGEAEYCFDLIEGLQKQAYDFKMDLTNIGQFKAFFLKDEKGGVLQTVRDYFGYQNQGYTNYEAVNMVLKTDVIRRPFFVLLMTLLLGSLLDRLTQSYSKREQKKDFSWERFSLGMCGEQFMDKTLPYPYVTKGRYFTFYQKNPEGPYVMDRQDKEAFRVLHEIFRHYFNPVLEFPYILSAFDQDTVQTIAFKAQGDYVMEFAFLGIPAPLMMTLNPLGDPVSQMTFLEDVSLFSRDDHQQLVKSDPTLSDYPVFRLALEKGFFLLGRGNFLRPCYPLKGKLDEISQTLLSPAFIKNDLLNQIFHYHYGFIPKSIEQQVLRMDDDQFRKTMLSVIEGNRKAVLLTNTVSLDEIALSYSGILLNALYQSIRNELYGETNEAVFMCYPKNGFYVSVGSNFTAYSIDRNPSHFYFDKSDRPLLIEALQAMQALCEGVKDKRERAKRITAGLGLPPVFIKPMYLSLLNESLDGGKLTEIFGFADKPEDLDDRDLLSYVNDFSLKKACHGGQNESTLSHHEALKQGFFLACPDTIVASFGDMASLTGDLAGTYQRIRRIQAYAFENLSGEARMTLRPSPAGFSSEVDLFIRVLRENNPDSLYLLCLKESLHQVFMTEDDFLVQAIRYLHGSNEKAFVRYLKSRLFRLRNNGFHQSFTDDDIIYGIALFLLFQEQQILYDISQRLMLTDK